MERKNGNFDFMDFNKLGKIAYKCKAYAKAIYYKENENQDMNQNSLSLYIVNTTSEGRWEGNWEALAI